MSDGEEAALGLSLEVASGAGCLAHVPELPGVRLHVAAAIAAGASA